MNLILTKKNSNIIMNSENSLILLFASCCELLSEKFKEVFEFIFVFDPKMHTFVYYL